MTIVRVADDLGLHGVRIAIAREYDDGKRWVAKLENGQIWAWEPVPEGAYAAPTLQLDYEVATALSAALADHFAGKSADRHLTAGELAERLSVPLQQVDQWERDGTGPRSIRVHPVTRYRLADVLAWEEAHATPAEAKP